MQLDLRTVTIKPVRNTFTHVAKYIGNEKLATRYQEGTIGLQATQNFHYRPLWQPQYEIFDAGRTAIKMSDWNKLLDPRQYYYGSYTLARARMQDAAEADFTLVESRGLAASVTDQVRDLALSLYVPLRHVEWGGNTNCMFMADYGYGTAFSAPSLFHAMDHLGMAQYVSRLGLVLGGVESLDAAKTAWMEDAAWQGLRKYVEDCFVVQDWAELFVAHCLVLDGVMYPLFYDVAEAKLAQEPGGAVISMLTRFQSEWFNEGERWVHAVTKAMAADSAENKALIEGWVAKYLPLALDAMRPHAERLAPGGADAILDELKSRLGGKLAKLGVAA